MKLLGSFILTILKLIGVLLFNPVILTVIAFGAVYLVYQDRKYKKTTYYLVTEYSYLSVLRDLGRYGEYLTYKRLKHFEQQGAKFLFNVYIPKSNGETTEIDVLMISPKGIFVFESKNYSGWIFGNESQRYWCQTLPAGRGRSHKEQFYNPIIQNKSHIKHLEALLGEQFPMRSIVVFSDRCELKNVQIRSNDISVINRHDVLHTVSAVCNEIPDDLLSENNIEEIYRKLYPYTQVDESTKAQHVANIQNNIKREPIEQDVPESQQPIESGNRIELTEQEAGDQPENAPAEDVQAAEVECNTHTVAGSETTESKVLKCPVCNGDLILRTATKGANAGKQFYGCSNYPKCKYTQNITNKTV